MDMVHVHEVHIQYMYTYIHEVRVQHSRNRLVSQHYPRYIRGVYCEDLPHNMSITVTVLQYLRVNIHLYLRMSIVYVLTTLYLHNYVRVHEHVHTMYIQGTVVHAYT